MEQELKIDKGIPLPPGAEPQRRYPFHEMERGDSVFFKGVNLQSAPCVAARRHGKTHSKEFACRKVEGGVRIWRVK